MTDENAANAGGESAPKPGPEVTPYELAPESPAPVSKDASPKAKIEADPFLDAFDDDTDFSDEANSPHGKRGKTVRDDDAPVPGQRIEPFILTGRGEAAIVAAVGGGVTVGAMIAVAMVQPTGKFPLAVNAALQVVLQTFTGVIALGLAAHLAGRPLGSLALGFARMLLAVAAFVLLISVNIPIPGRFDEALLAFAAYAGILILTGRRPIQEWFPVIASHAVLAVLLWAAFALHTWAATAALPKPIP